MNKNYAIPVAALALAGATGCSEPITGDWDLTQMTDNGRVRDISGEDSYYGYTYSHELSLRMSIDADMTTELLVTYELNYTGPDGNSESDTETFSYNGEVTPGTSSGRGTYRIDLEDSISLECELKKDPVDLSCEELGSTGHWYFEPA
ncbi:MAG: hypothetical protein ACI9VR_002154 [Cognaticolwellia sp.]|jgi:hypothetical protein